MDVMEFKRRQKYRPLTILATVDVRPTLFITLSVHFSVYSNGKVSINERMGLPVIYLRWPFPKLEY